MFLTSKKVFDVNKISWRQKNALTSKKVFDVKKSSWRQKIFYGGAINNNWSDNKKCLWRQNMVCRENHVHINNIFDVEKILTSNIFVTSFFVDMAVRN